MRVFAVIYIAIGILYHLVSSPNAFAWSDPWLYVTIGLWPIFLLGWICVLLAVGFVIFLGYEKYKKMTRLTPKERMELKEKQRERRAKERKAEERRQ